MHTNPTSIIIIGSIIIFLGGMTQGLTGFGFGLVTMPILILLLPPVLVVPLITIISIFITITILFEARKHVQIKRIIPLIIAGICGLPIGAYVLKTLNPNVLKVIIGFIIVAFSLVQLSGYRKTVKDEKYAFLPIGFISGFLNTSTALSGPPIILFFTNQNVKKEVFRANIVAYFTVVNVFSIAVLISNDIVSHDVIKHSLIFFPSMIVGAVIGIRLSHIINETLFRKIALIIILTAGMVSIISGLKIGILP